MRSLVDFDLKDKRVLVRCDFNVPLSKEGEILDDFRIKQALPTIFYLMENKAKIVLMSHLGRPGGKAVEGLKMDPVQVRLMEYLDVSVTKAPDCVGEEIEKWTKKMIPGEILMLENLRFHKGEEEGDKSFAAELAKMGDFYINDAFGASHRAHASISGVPELLPSGAGLLLQREVEELSALMESPQKPLVAVIGGAKADTKMKVIDRISAVADWVLISGLLDKAIIKENIELKYPGKVVKPVDEARDGKDIGPETIRIFKEKILEAGTVFWNGPFGKIEEEEFSQGTEEIAKAIIKSGSHSVIGGGETVEFVNRIGLLPKFSHASTGGGAMLEFLSGKELPGIEALK